MPEVEWGSRGAEKVFRDNEKIAKSVRSTGDAAKDAARDAEQLGRIAQRIAKDNETSWEKFSRQVKNAKKAFDDGKISAELLRRETDRVTREFERAGTTSKKAFDAGTVGQYAAGLAGMAASAFSVANAFREIEARAAAAGERVLEAIDHTGELAQLAVSLDNLESLRSQAKQLVNRGIAADSGQGAQLAFQFASAGLSTADQEAVFSVAQRGLIGRNNILGVGRAIGKFRQAFGGTTESALDVLQQAATSTSGTLSQTAEASLEFAQGAGKLGLSREEALAAFATVEREAKNPAAAATQMKALLSKVRERGVQVSGVEDMVTQIGTAASRSKKGAFGVLGSVEAVQAFDVLSARIPEFRKTLSEISTADERNVASEAAERNLQVPEMAAGLAVRRERGATAVAEEEAFATRRNLAGAVLSGRRRSAVRGGRMAQFGAWMQEMAHPYLLSDERVLQGEAEQGYRNVQPETAAAIRQHLGEPMSQGAPSRGGGGEGVPAAAEATAILGGIRDELQRQTNIMQKGEQRAPQPGGRRE